MIIRYSFTRLAVQVLIPALLLCISGCDGSPDPPFQADPREGTFNFLGGEGMPGGMMILVNNSPVLKDAFIFSDHGRLVCINTVDHMDIIVTFGTLSRTGSMAVSLVNTADGNRQVNSLVVLSFFLVPGVRARQTDGMGLEITDTVDNAVPWRIEPPGGGTWGYAWLTREDTISLRLQQGSSPVMLLPGEKLDLPSVSFY